MYLMYVYKLKKVKINLIDTEFYLNTVYKLLNDSKQEVGLQLMINSDCSAVSQGE